MKLKNYIYVLAIIAAAIYLWGTHGNKPVQESDLLQILVEGGVGIDGQAKAVIDEALENGAVVENIDENTNLVKINTTDQYIFEENSDIAIAPTKRRLKKIRKEFENFISTKQAVKVTGFFEESEAQNMNDDELPEFESLGLARAHEVVKNLVPEYYNTHYPDNLPFIVIEDKQVEDGTLFSEKRGEILSQLYSVEFIKSQTGRPGRLAEFDDGAVIYFPSGSDDKIQNEEVDIYLKKLIVRLERTRDLVEIIGHTDSLGDDKANYTLALQRAQDVADVLTQGGIQKARIRVVSEGEDSPIASNSTAEGRQKNRRVEIKLK